MLAAQSTTPAVPDQAALETMTARFAPTDITADVSGLPAGERQALGKLVQASRIIDALFLRQVWAGNEARLMRLLSDATPLGRARLHAFLVNKGPWSRLDHDAPFIPGVPPKPGGANFYPAGATKAEVEAWIAGLPADERRRATGFFTTDSPHAAGIAAAVRRRPLQPRVPGRARARSRPAPRGGRARRRSRR